MYIKEKIEYAQMLFKSSNCNDKEVMPVLYIYGFYCIFDYKTTKT